MTARAPSELDFERLVETAPQGIWLVDAGARTLYVNPRMAHMLGDAPARLLGSAMLEFVTDESKPVARRHFEQRHSGASARYQLKLKRGNGSEFWASVSSQAFEGSAGAHDIGALAFVDEISEPREQATQVAIHDRLTAAGTLAAGVAHEINNPLASVIANLELALPVLDGLGTEPRAAADIVALREHMDDARDAARRIQAVLDDLQAFARHQSAPPPSAAAQPARRGRVLVIDDELMMTKVLARTIGNGHDVTTTTAAAEALQMIADGQRFDVILCDLMMPQISGMEFHTELAQRNADQARRVIFLTGGAFTPRMRAFLDSNANICLEKPFDPTALRELVDRRVREG